MPLKRTRNWAQHEFDAHLRAHAHTPFQWGVNDCCMAPANAILAFTGTDIAADFRGKYHDKSTAIAAIASITGGSTVADAAAYCAAKHGLVEYKHPLCAQRGDLVVMQQPGADALDQIIAGIVHLNGVHLITAAEHGLVRLPITAVKRAWKV